MRTVTGTKRPLHSVQFVGHPDLVIADDQFAGSIPLWSLTDDRMRCLQPRYRSAWSTNRRTAERIAYYEQEILRKLAEMERGECQGQEVPQVKNPKKRQAMKRRGEEPMRQALYRMSGVDLTGIDAIGVETVQIVLSEYGPDLTR